MSEMMTVKGRKAEVQQYHEDSWRIVSGHDILGRDLWWRHWSTLTCAVFGSREEAEAFLRQHADPPAASEPAGEGRELPNSWGHWTDKHGNHWWAFGRPGKFMMQLLDPETGMPDDEASPRRICTFGEGMKGSWHKAAPARPWLTGPEAKTLLADLERQRGTIARLNEQLAEAQRERDQWESQWHDASDYQLVKDCLDGTPVSPPPGSVAEKVAALREQLAEAQRLVEMYRNDAAEDATNICKGCGRVLQPENAALEDGCPCNSPAGCNAGNNLISEWRKEQLRTASVSLTARDEELRRLAIEAAAAFEHYDRIRRSHVQSEFIKENGRKGGSPFAEMCDAMRELSAALATTPAPRTQENQA